jgi:hypothetical protein
MTFRGCRFVEMCFYHMAVEYSRHTGERNCRLVIMSENVKINARRLGIGVGLPTTGSARHGMERRGGYAAECRLGGTG